MGLRLPFIGGGRREAPAQVNQPVDQLAGLGPKPEEDPDAGIISYYARGTLELIEIEEALQVKFADPDRVGQILARVEEDRERRLTVLAEEATKSQLSMM